MARYTGPVCKLCRREGMKLFLKGDRCLTPKCAISRRNAPPGPRPQRRPPRPSEYATQLREKQKARRTYGVLERQFRRHFAEANRRTGNTGENLLQVLESRLDNVVYRLGLAASRPAARQIVNHGHIMVNGRRCDIPSRLLRPSDMVTVRPKSRSLGLFEDVVAGAPPRQPPEWLAFDAATLEARIETLPARGEIDVQISEQLIVEFYSR